MLLVTDPCPSEAIIRTVEALAAQKRVLVCPVCNRRLVQIEQMVGCVCSRHDFLLPALIPSQVFESHEGEVTETSSPEDDAPDEDGLVEHWAPNLARAVETGECQWVQCMSRWLRAVRRLKFTAAAAGFGAEDKWYMGKGGMMKLCESMCRRVTVVTGTEIMRLERKTGSHLYTLYKKVKADVSLRGLGARDTSALTKPLELACGSFEAVICCLPPKAASNLMQNVSDVCVVASAGRSSSRS